MKKNDENDGILKKSEGYEQEAFQETFDQFETRFERNVKHFYESLGMEKVESDVSMSSNDEEDEEDLSEHNTAQNNQ